MVNLVVDVVFVVVCVDGTVGEMEVTTRTERTTSAYRGRTYVRLKDGAAVAIAIAVGVVVDVKRDGGDLEGETTAGVDATFASQERGLIDAMSAHAETTIAFVVVVVGVATGGVEDGGEWGEGECQEGEGGEGT